MFGVRILYHASKAAMSNTLLLSKIIANLPWQDARQLLLTKYDLSIDETDQLFCAKYVHDSRVWTHGTEEQQMMLKQNRGTIYEKVPPYRLVCLPFYKFWNYNEPHAAIPNGQCTSYTEKMDGSFFKVYYFQGEWYVSSNSRIDIHQFREKYIRCGKTNHQLWQDAAVAAGLDFTKLNQNHAYFFERVHPDYKIVIQYEKPMLYHLGTRDMSTLQELETDIGVPKPRSFQFANFEQCLQYVNQMRFTEGEGIVACDVRTYHRVKIKSPSYLMVHYRTVGVEKEDKQTVFCMFLWLQGEQEEYLNYFPEVTEDYNRIEHQIEQSIIPSLMAEFTALYNSESKIFFASLNSQHSSTGKPDLDKRRLIFTKLFRQYHHGDWNQLSDQERHTAVRLILRQRNADNYHKFIFEKYLRSFITVSSSIESR